MTGGGRATRQAKDIHAATTVFVPANRYTSAWQDVEMAGIVEQQHALLQVAGSLTGSKKRPSTAARVHGCAAIGLA